MTAFARTLAAAAALLFAPLAAHAQDASALTMLIEDALAQRQPAARHEVTLTGAPAMDGTPVLDSLDYQERTGVFSAVVRAEGGAPVRVTGRARSIVEAPALARPIRPGERIGAGDIVYVEVDAARLSADTLLDPAEVVGQEARRALRAETPLRPYDVKPPAAVRKNEIITVYYIRPGITLAARGRALDDAAAGEAVRVLNLQSNRVIEAVAESAGRARVESPRQYAAAQ